MNRIDELRQVATDVQGKLETVEKRGRKTATAIAALRDRLAAIRKNFEAKFEQLSERMKQPETVVIETPEDLERSLGLRD